MFTPCKVRSMTIAAYLGLLGTWIAAITTPGPDTVQIIRLGSRSRHLAVWAAVGICTGNILWPIVTMAGLSALIAAFPWILAVLYLAGGLFLIRMGIGSFRSGWAERRAEQNVSVPSHSDASTANDEAGVEEKHTNTATAAWRLGLATNLSNPKALLFFGAVFAQFLPVGITMAERVIVLVMMTAVGLVWFCGFAWLVSMPLWARKLQQFNPIIEMAAGVIFALLGLFLLFNGVEKLLHL